MVPVCDKPYHTYNRFRHFWAEIKKLWNYPFCSPVAGPHLGDRNPLVCRDTEALEAWLLHMLQTTEHELRYPEHLARPTQTCHTHGQNDLNHHCTEYMYVMLLHGINIKCSLVTF